jgi:segregation and condensation protein A
MHCVASGKCLLAGVGCWLRLPAEVGPMDFCIQLDDFRGPLDLLLFLVRRHEVDIRDMPIALITDQYLAHLAVLEQLDVNEVGDFLELASTLVEIKSQLVLPRGGEEMEGWDDPRNELVARLLEYKKYKDAASMLDERSRDWQRHYGRVASDLPPRQIDPAGQPIHEVELWDLVSAIGRILRESQALVPQAIVFDETPIQVYMQRMHDKLVATGRIGFSEMFQPGMHKSAIVGMFLAVLELVRHHSVRAEQDDLHGEIWIVPGDQFDPTREIVASDDENRPADTEDTSAEAR